MTRFAYRAVDTLGQRVRRVEEAPDAPTLTRALTERGFVVLDLAPADADDAAQRIVSASFGRRREVMETTRALGSLLTAGVPLARALTTASGIVSSSVVAAALQDVRARAERGESLATALSGRPDLFSPVYVGVIRAGERSGDLAGAFTTLAAQLEREERLRSRLLSASIYPLVLATAGGVAVMVLLLFVLPRFAGMLTDAGVPLPRSTALLLTLHAGARQHWLALVTLVTAALALLLGARTTTRGQRATTGFVLLLPVVGSLRRHVLAARFARITGVLLGGGAPLLSALDDAGESMTDPLARDEVVRIRTRVREGSTLHGAVAEGALFPRLLSQLVAVGEESGELRDFLLKAADIIEERTDRLLQRLVALAEPGIIVVFGGLVGFVALSLMQAIYGVNAGTLR